MGSKDILEKHLESYNDVFADMINVFIFDGKAVIAENELEDIDPKWNIVNKVDRKKQKNTYHNQALEAKVIEVYKISFTGYQSIAFLFDQEEAYC